MPDPDAETDPETYKYKLPKKQKKKEKPVPVPVNEEGGEGGGGVGDGSGDGSGNGAGEKGKRKFVLPIPIQEMRNIFISQGSSRTRRIFFTPEESCQAQLRISASGLSDKKDFENLYVKSSNEGRIEKGKLFLDLKAGERKKIDIEFAEEYEGPIELVVVNTLKGGNNEI